MRVDRTVVRVRKLHDDSAKREDREYWLSRPPQERFEAVDLLRLEYGQGRTRFQRVFRIIERRTR